MPKDFQINEISQSWQFSGYTHPLSVLEDNAKARVLVKWLRNSIYRKGREVQVGRQLEARQLAPAEFAKVSRLGPLLFQALSPSDEFAANLATK